MSRSPVHPSTIRFAGALVVAGIAALVAGVGFSPRHILLSAPIAMAACYIGWTLVATARIPVERLVSLANDGSGTLVSDILVLVAALGSLGAVGAVIMKGDPGSRLLDGLLCLVTVVLSWAMVHVNFAVRYAHLYWTAPVGGIDFNEEAPPDTWDFLYFSFTLGMTYAVSDTNVTAKSVRRTALGHCLVSYLFGTMIVACAINLVLGLIAA